MEIYSTRIASWCQCYKNLYVRNFSIFCNNSVFVPGTPSQPSLMFAVKARATQVKHYSCAPLYGTFLALPTNIILGWNNLPATNTVAYYKIVHHGKISFYKIGPWLGSECLHVCSKYFYVIKQSILNRSSDAASFPSTK
jgi:hypothetical protein